jgi:phenylacetate-CoA ligase
VRQAWGDEPFNQYGATETADIAAEHVACRRMHFFEDLVMAEVVDDHYQPVPPGEYGAKVLVTSLFSRTQPLIRYELNDSVRVAADDHHCGLPFAVLESLQGRVEDALSLPAISGGQMKVQPLVFNRVMDIAPVAGWQIAQQADGGLLLLLTGSPSQPIMEDLPRSLEQSLAREGASVPYIRVQPVTAIPKAPSGKSPLIRAHRETTYLDRGTTALP